MIASVPGVPDGFRYPTMLLAFVTLVLAVLGGLNRIGFSAVGMAGPVAVHHGGLMVSGFLGTVIAMERAVSLPVKGSLLVPVLNVVGALGLILGMDPVFGVLLMVIASLGLVGLFTFIYQLQPSLHNFVLVLGGLCWFVGNGLWWWGRPVPEAVPWWMGFLILVIAAERLELNRLKRFGLLQKASFVGSVVLSLIGMLGVYYSTVLGAWLYAVGFLGMASWLILHDMVRQLLFAGGERGYTGWCLFSGYLWLAGGALLRMIYPEATAGFFYDAYLHSIFLGFVFTMIFGHAFIIMPGVLNVELTYHVGFYVPLILLEATLVFRIIADITTHQILREWTGLGNGLVLGLFFLMLIETGIRSQFREETGDTSSEGNENGSAVQQSV